MKITLCLIGGWAAIGWVVGLPLCAILDVIFDCEPSDRGSTLFCLIGWPVIVIFALILLPIEARDRIYKS
jgi:hypothetical protein